MLARISCDPNFIVQSIGYCHCCSVAFEFWNLSNFLPFYSMPASLSLIYLIGSVFSSDVGYVDINA